MVKEKSVIRQFYTARANAILKKDEEEIKLKNNQRPWGIYGERLKDFNRTFIDVGVLNSTIDTYIAERKQRFGHAFVLDAMGPGSFFKELEIDGGLAITLSDPRSPEEIRRDNSSNIQIISGDILQGATWRQVRDYVTENQNSMNGGFDLVVCRPYSGWNVMRDRDNTDPYDFPEQVIANKLFKTLSPTGGTLLLQLPLFQMEYLQWIHKLRKNTGTNVRQGHSGFVSITKCDPSINTLPRIH